MRFVEPFARNQERNARRVRGQQHAGDAPFELIDGRARFRGAPSWRTHRPTSWRVACRTGTFRGHPCDVGGAIVVVYLVAQVFSRCARIGVVRRQTRQDAPHWLVSCRSRPELLQGGEQGVPSAFGDANGEHDEERIQPVFQRNPPCSSRYFVTIEAGMPVLAKFARPSSPGVTMVDLIGSSMLKPGARFPKPCHFRWLSAPSLRAVGLPRR